jgi:hypothetical protein
VAAGWSGPGGANGDEEQMLAPEAPAGRVHTDAELPPTRKNQGRNDRPESNVLAGNVESPMASRATIFFAGVATVIVATGIGFGGALLLTETKPIRKEPPAAFAKRDEPLPVQAKPAEPIERAPAPAPTMAIETVPRKAEDVAALKFLPPETTGAAPTPDPSPTYVAPVAPAPVAPAAVAPVTPPAPQPGSPSRLQQPKYRQ